VWNFHLGLRNKCLLLLQFKLREPLIETEQSQDLFRLVRSVLRACSPIWSLLSSVVSLCSEHWHWSRSQCSTDSLLRSAQCNSAVTIPLTAPCAKHSPPAVHNCHCNTTFPFLLFCCAVGPYSPALLWLILKVPSRQPPPPQVLQQGPNGERHLSYPSLKVPTIWAPSQFPQQDPYGKQWPSPEPSST